ncbi:hypothetical protein VSR34_27725 [Paraburkholderia sp. JHI2823]|uniref:hypothetical protein n=1 Tax=Paraburkholderia sp. JHI2823 TaxID=3112960 RepID=UPI00316D8ED9
MVKRREVPPRFWVLARIAWERDSRITFAQIASELTVSRQGVRARAVREGWRRKQEKGATLFTYLLAAEAGRAPPVYVASTGKGEPADVGDALVGLVDILRHAQQQTEALRASIRWRQNSTG